MNCETCGGAGIVPGDNTCTVGGCDSCGGCYAEEPCPGCYDDELTFAPRLPQLALDLDAEVKWESPD